MSATYPAQLLAIIQKAAPQDAETLSHGASYHGTTHRYYFLKNPIKYAVAKQFKKDHPDLAFNEYIELINALNQGESYEEKTIASTLLSLYKNHKKKVTPEHIDKWLEHLEGWAEIDSLCQSLFSAEELLGNWKEWKQALTNFSKSSEIAKRRASLVLLTKPVRDTTDERIKTVAFAHIERLKSEKDILITKAISWLLRDMIQNYKNEVEEYIEKNKESLPAIAVRETRRKLMTGRK